MRDTRLEKEHFNNKSTVYGPVKSRRFGMSLGIDPIFHTSTCSFNCIYCQLGHIQRITREFKIYVPTEQVIEDYKSHLTKGEEFEVVTYSGSGEPTLASNLGEIIQEIRNITPAATQMVLTNATELARKEIQGNLRLLDRVIVKIDAPNEEIFSLINRPAKGITLASTLAAIADFKKGYTGTLEVQSMFMPVNLGHVEEFAKILKEINPAVVQINTPERPYPSEWHRENRGNHAQIYDYQTRPLKVIERKDALAIKEELERLTDIDVICV